MAVPPLAGLDQAAAGSVAQQAGFKLSPRTQAIPVGDPRNGRIISQDVPPGTQVSAAITLGVVVGVAPAPPPPTTTTLPAAPGAPTTSVP